MFEDVKIKVHNVARVLRHLPQDRMYCVVEIHNVAIWRAVINTNYVCLITEMKFSKYTFNMIINYIKFTEFSTSFDGSKEGCKRLRAYFLYI